MYVCVYVCTYVCTPLPWQCTASAGVINPMQGDSCITTGCCGCQLKLNVYINRRLVQGLSYCHGKGYKLVITHSPKMQLRSLSFASTSYCILPAALGSQLN